MQKNLLYIVIALLSIGVIVVLIFIVKQLSTEPRVTLSGNVVPLVEASNNLGATDPNQQLQLTISLRLHNEAELNTFLTAVNDPHSSQYHQFLTADQFKQQYAPTDSEVQQVVAFLQSQGFTIKSIAANNTLIDATGTVAQAEQAFGVQINNYQFKSRHFYANANEPSVPASLSQLILSIGGLDNAAKSHPEA